MRTSSVYIHACRVFVALAAAATFTFCARGGIAYGTINNFDTVNDTGVECHGFEIELEDIHSVDMTYTYNWNHYGTPKITEDNSNATHPKVRIRYESAKRADGSWAAYTAIPAGPIPPTAGHQFTNPALNFGGEHFGAGYRGTPTNVVYHWLIDDGSGTLVPGPSVNVATPVFTYYPPAGGGVAQVEAAIKPPPPEVHPREFGPASWVKEIRTTTHNNHEVELRNLVSDDPEDPNDKNWRNSEPDEVETEWQILQTDFKKADGGRNGELKGAPEDLNNGDEIITRRYEFYKYVGPLDAETGEALAEKVAADGIHGVIEYATNVIVGDFVGSQMAAFDNELPVGLIEHLPDGEEGSVYATRAVAIAGVPFKVTTTGRLPVGLNFDLERGELSGTPTESGIFTFGVTVTATNSPEQAKTYTLAIAAAGEELPPHSVVETSEFPRGCGEATGGGFYTNETTATVFAKPAVGFAFVSWSENGKIVSRTAAYSFTNIVNRTLVANFAPMPALSLTGLESATLVLSWPTNDVTVVLEESPVFSPEAWVKAQQAVTVNGTNNTVTISPTDEKRFFRLARP
jgi:hypothetical protein